MSKNNQTLHGPIFSYVEQLSEFNHFQNPTRILVIKFGTDSNLNLL
jgi:hypothetical protein